MQTVNDFIETDLGNISPNPRGDYDSTVTYEYLDLVTYQGGSYLCVAELGSAVTGVTPVSGKVWQTLTLPGDLTPEYIAMHDSVANKAEQVAADRQTVEESRQAVETIQLDVEQLHNNTRQAAEAAESSKDSAAGYAQAADASREAAATSEANVNAQVTGFDEHVADKTADTKAAITQARQQAVRTVASQQATSIQTVKDQTASYIAEKETSAKTEIENYTSEKIAEINKKASEANTTLANTIADGTTLKTQLETTISTADTSKKNLDAFNTAAGKTKTALDSSNATATQTKSRLDSTNKTASDLNTSLGEKITEGTRLQTDLQTTGETAVNNLQTEANKQIQNIIAAGGGIENALANYFALRRTGRVFSTKIYKWETSTSPVGVKLNANETMVCEPSVGRTKGRDDYEQYGLFHHFTCNFSVDANGFNNVDALEGQIGFSRTGKVQVGEVTMSAWFGIEDTADAVIYHYSDTKSELTPQPMKECINPDNTISPFMIHGKYLAGDIDGMPYSSKGLAPANGCAATEAKKPIGYSGMIGYMHKLGTHYCGTTSWDLFYRQLMMIIKYATTNSASKMAGCISYNYQEKAVVAETGVSRVILTKAKAANYIVGSYVSVGEMGEATNIDRYQSYMHNLAYIVKVLKIEDVDDSNAAIYVDAPAFDTTLTTYISTMPWRTGSTDEVVGSDGSLGNNTSGKYAYKIQGIETCVGGYEVLGNVVMDIVTGSDGNPARDVYVCEDASILTTNIATIKEKYKKAIAQVPYTAGAWKYISEETVDANLGIMIPTEAAAGSQTGFADGLNVDTGASGQREWLALGGLYSGDQAGLWLLRASLGLASANWCILSGVSPNGTRGEYQATA